VVFPLDLYRLMMSRHVLVTRRVSAQTTEIPPFDCAQGKLSAPDDKTLGGSRAGRAEARPSDGLRMTIRDAGWLTMCFEGKIVVISQDVCGQATGCHEGQPTFWPYLAKKRWNGFINEIAVSVSRQPNPRRRANLPASSLRHRIILCCALSGVAWLLAVTTTRDAVWIPAPTRASVVCVPVVSPEKRPTPASVVCVPVASPEKRPTSSPLSTAQVGNRFEPEYRIDDRAPLVLVSVPAHPAFSGPMWRFLLHGPVRPDIDRMHNPTYYGIVVTIPFGG